MLSTTIEIIKSVLKGDTTLSASDRVRILGLLRESAEPPKVAGLKPELRVLRRSEAAKRLGCSVTLVDRLAKEGSLPKYKFPNRRRASGILESDLNLFLAARKPS